MRYFVLILILSKLFINAFIIEDIQLHEDKHDLKGHERSHKDTLDKFFIAHSFITDFDEIRIRIFILENVNFS